MKISAASLLKWLRFLQTFPLLSQLAQSVKSGGFADSWIVADLTQALKEKEKFIVLFITWSIKKLHEGHRRRSFE